MAQDLAINLMVSFCWCIGAREVIGGGGLSIGWGGFNVRELFGSALVPQDAQEGMLGFLSS